jgi:hypothetical protein
MVNIVGFGAAKSLTELRDAREVTANLRSKETSGLAAKSKQMFSNCD